MKAKISEIFYSIQGEGPYQGKHQVFLRFFDCNLRCSYCDTRFYGFKEYEETGLLVEVDKHRPIHSVSITGGEPLLQVSFLENFLPLLKKNGIRVYLETNGIFYQNLAKLIEHIDIVSMDFKLPSATGGGEYWSWHREFLRVASIKEVFVKAVIGPATSASDIKTSLDIIQSVKPDTMFVLQSQNPFEDELRDKVESFLVLCQERGVKAAIINQLHKQLGVR